MNKVSLLRACNITTGKKDSNAATKNGKYLFFTCAPEPLRINSFCFDDDVILLAGNFTAKDTKENLMPIKELIY